jgi:hypothetical protein
MLVLQQLFTFFKVRFSICVALPKVAKMSTVLVAVSGITALIFLLLDFAKGSSTQAM